MIRRYTAARVALKKALGCALFVSTTADCWSSRKRSFVGLTVHWMTDDLVRKNACLAVKRVKGKITFQVLAKVMANVNKEFKIQNKLTATVTDSGSNFVKAFRLFAKPFPDTDSENISLNDENDDSADFNLSESELNAGIYPKFKK